MSDFLLVQTVLWDYLSAILSTTERSEVQMTESFELRYVRGHVEVYDGAGRFCFSADNVSEAREELREMAA